MTDFRREFKDFDDAVLISIEEFGQLLGLTPGAMGQKRHYGELPEPCIQGGKVLRWRSGDVRDWLNKLKQDRRPDSVIGVGKGKRLGRPRAIAMEGNAA